MGPQPLVCPSCAEPHPLDARFCRLCNMPLVYDETLGAGEPLTPKQERARKIKPQYAEGPLVRAAGAQNQAEAEFIQGMLLEEGVPSALQRTRGFDVPDMLAAGPRDVMVPQSGYAVAREVLLQAEIVTDERAAPTPPARVLAGLLAACAIVALIAWIGTHLG
ncbi:MAG: hypothetical protein QOE11_2063 [Solirubrobacteraceae bacterium]|jgi:hypothetical protein|nr:hypothetical protein [Solirubrobacteraceae bacterium]